VWPSARLLEDRPTIDLGELLPPFTDGFDLLGDGSLIGVPLPGHARGQFGLLCRLEDGRRLFLLADAAWIAPNVTAAVDPRRIVDHLAHDAAAYWATLARLRELHRRRPDIVLIPSHCAASAQAWSAEERGRA
jgi:glyoxylase-like metal-dependent hydrolase (beta-lactamase superfamily II)